MKQNTVHACKTCGQQVTIQIEADSFLPEQCAGCDARSYRWLGKGKQMTPEQLIEETVQVRKESLHLKQERNALKAEVDRLRRVKDEPLERAIQEKETFRAKRNKK